MKKLLSIVLSIMILCSIFTGFGTQVNGAEIYDASTGIVSGKFVYEVLNDGTAEITDYTGYAENLIIPSKIDDYTVTKLGYRSFDDCVSVKTLALPVTLTEIDDYAFRNCTNLKSVTLTHNIHTIGDWAFRDCTSLESITLPDREISVGREAFINTKYYNTESNWINDVLYIDTFVIAAKTTLTGKCVVKEGTKRTGSHAFLLCQQIEEIVLPSTMVNIGVSAFGGCSGLKKITIPDSVISIGDYAFDYCGSLESIDIPENVLSIGNFAFEYCTSLKKLVIPDKVKTIGSSAFYNCTGLVSLVLGKEVKEIAPSAFASCTTLKSVLLNDKVEIIDENAFLSCSNMSHTHYIGTEEQWKEIEIASGNNMLTSVPRAYKDDVDVVKKEPTCTEDGLYEYFCNKCEYNYVVEYEKLGHTMATDAAVAPTCTEPGLTEGSHCSVCKEVFVEQEVVLPLGHTEVVDKAYGPTCDETGRTEGSHCSVCNEVFVKQEIIDALGHVWQDWQVLTQRTDCDKKGVLIRVCDICSDYEFKIIPASGHSVQTVGKKSATYFEKGYTGDSVCEDCGKVVTKGKAIAKLKLKTPTVKYTAGKKKMSVKYTKVKDATGFQVSYTFGCITTMKTFDAKKNVTKIINNLGKGKYSVKIRAFTKQGGKVAYSAWTKAKKVKVK